MDLPAIWQTPIANATYKNGARSYVDGDSINITYTFLRTVSRIEYVKGSVPPGVNATPTGIQGTITPLEVNVPTPPKDYQLTVRAYTNADSGELAAGYPTNWFEDRTFTIIGGLWYDPAAGELNNNGLPYQHGDAVSTQFSFDPGRSPSVALIGGSLPPGVTFSPVSMRLGGTVGALPKDITEYPLLFRASINVPGSQQFQDRSFSFAVNPLDEKHGWDTDWLNSLNFTNNPPGYTGAIYLLGTIYRGTNVEIQLKVRNPDNDPLTFVSSGAVVPYGTWYEGLPEGLSITNDGKIIGTPTVAENEPGYYFFRVYARDPQGTEGQPRTSELVFYLNLSPDIQLSQELNDTVKWLTPAGSLGSTYETFASHFSVQAVPQFNLTVLNNEYQTVQYQLIGSSPFPVGITLNPSTGDIIGTMPHVDSDVTYTFVIRARVVFINKTDGTVRNSTAYSDRQFSFTVKNLYFSDSVCNIYIAVPAFDRREISKWVYGTLPEYHDDDYRAPSILTVLGRDVLFRRDDPSWGRIQQPRILLVAGLATPSPNNMSIALRDYHHTFTLRFGDLRWAKGVDPSGNYVYDVLYFNVIDPMQGAGGFDAFGGDVLLAPPTNVAIPQFNLEANSDRYHPVSINNARQDLINVANRIAWLDNPEKAETAANRGIGIPGQEGLPFWMTCEQVAGKKTSVLGYMPAIELAYLKPGKGPQAVKSLVQAGFQKALEGHPIKVDRYLLISDGQLITRFDINLVDDTLTTFDGPDCNPSTLALTTFDLTYKPTSKYYKFPPGDA